MYHQQLGRGVSGLVWASKSSVSKTHSSSALSSSADGQLRPINESAKNSDLRPINAPAMSQSLPSTCVRRCHRRRPVSLLCHSQVALSAAEAAVVPITRLINVITVTALNELTNRVVYGVLAKCYHRQHWTCMHQTQIHAHVHIIHTLGKRYI